MYHYLPYCVVSLRSLMNRASLPLLENSTFCRTEFLGYLISSCGSQNYSVPLPISHAFLLQYPVLILQIQTEHLFNTGSQTQQLSKARIMKKIHDSYQSLLLDKTRFWCGLSSLCKAGGRLSTSLMFLGDLDSTFSSVWEIFMIFVLFRFLGEKGLINLEYLKADYSLLLKLSICQMEHKVVY